MNFVVDSLSSFKKKEAVDLNFEQEKMPWSQMLLRRDSSFVKFDKKYDLNAIPMWLLLDSKGEVVSRQVGYDKGENAVDQKVAMLLLK